MNRAVRTDDSTPTAKGVDEVLKEEKKPDLKGTPDLSPEIDLTTLNEAFEKFAKKLDDLGGNLAKQSIGAPKVNKIGSSSQPNFWYLFRRLIRSGEKQSKMLIKTLRNLGGEETETPLEADVIVNTLAQEVKLPVGLDQSINKAA